MENLKNIAPIEDFNWDAYENGDAVTSVSKEDLEKAMNWMLQCFQMKSGGRFQNRYPFTRRTESSCSSGSITALRRRMYAGSLPWERTGAKLLRL